MDILIASTDRGDSNGYIQHVFEKNVENTYRIRII